MSINVIFEMIKVFFDTAWLMFKAFLSLFPVYEMLSSVKEFLIAQVLGVPVWVISIIFAIPTIISVISFVIKKLLS